MKQSGNLTTTVQKWGDGLGICVPTAIAAQVSLAVGTEIEFDISSGFLVIRPLRKRRRGKVKLSELLARLKPHHRHGEWVNDPPVGREII